MYSERLVRKEVHLIDRRSKAKLHQLSSLLERIHQHPQMRPGATRHQFDMVSIFLPSTDSGFRHESTCTNEALAESSPVLCAQSTGVCTVESAVWWREARTFTTDKTLLDDHYRQILATTKLYGTVGSGADTLAMV